MSSSSWAGTISPAMNLSSHKLVVAVKPILVKYVALLESYHSTNATTSRATLVIPPHNMLWVALKLSAASSSSGIVS